MRILKGNKELTSPSIAAALILTNTQVKQEEEIRKQNELNRQSTYEQTKQMAQNALNKANGMTQLKTGKFADRPVTPDGKMLYLATDKASGNPDQYTIYDVSPVIMDHEVSNIPDVSVAKGMALVVFPDFDDTVELPHIITWSTNGILFVAYSASEAVASNDDYDYYIGFNSRTSFIQLQNEGSDWIFSNACSPESGEFDAGYVAVTKNEISETGYADLLSKVTDSNYSIKDLINHDQAYYDGGGTEYFFGVSSTEDVWSWHNGIGGSSDLTGYPLLETGLFADRPASPSNKMLYLATDKASGDQDRYTIYDKEYTIGNPYTQFNVPDITEAKTLAKANNASFDDSLDLTKISKVLGPDGTTITVWYTSGEMFVFNNTANSSYELAFARTPMIVLAYIEGTWTVLQAVNSDDAGFSDLYGTTEVMSFTSATDDAAGYNELIGLIQGANYNVRDYINHDEAYYTGGGAEYFVNETPIDNVWVWSWHNNIGGGSSGETVDLTEYPILKTGLFADRPAAPTSKMIYLATDKAVDNADQYTIYDQVGATWSWHNNIGGSSGGGSSDLTEYAMLKTGLFADRPSSPTGKMIYLSTDKATNDAERYTIYDSILVLDPYTQFGIPTVTEAKQKLLAGASLDWSSYTFDKVLIIKNVTNNTIKYVIYSDGEMYVDFTYAASTTVRVMVSANTRAIVLRDDGDGVWDYCNRFFPNGSPYASLAELTKTTSGIDSREADFISYQGFIVNVNYNMKDYLHHDEAYYTGGGTEYLKAKSPDTGTNVWSWYKDIASLYTHPTGDGNLHIPATGATNNGKVLKAGSTEGSASWGSLAKADVGLSNVDNTADSSKPVSTAMQTALDTKVDKVTGKGLSTNDYTTEEKDKLANMTGSGAETAASIGAIVNTATAKTVPVDADAVGLMDSADGNILKKVTWAIIKSLLQYAHPTTDGNLHVPATGTTNNGKYLKAGSTAGSFSWSSITVAKADVGLGNVDNTADINKPISTAVQTALNSKANSRQTFNATALAANWVGASAPYTITITVAGITAAMNPMYDVVLTMADTALATQEKASFNYIDDLDTGDGVITLTCLENKPTVDLNIRMTEG